ncbi:MAG: hypothetical protein RR066_03960 [Mucinivorans sp.]
MKRYIFYILLVVALFGAQTLLAQPTSGSKAEYAALAAKEAKLKISEDSVLNLIAQNRKVFEANPSGTNIGDEIVRLEGELFDLRAARSRVGSQRAMMEAEMARQDVLQPVVTPDGPSLVVKAVPRSANLFLSEYFVQNLSAKDIVLLNGGAKVALTVAQIKSQVDELYDKLMLLKDHYDKVADQDSVNQMLQKSDTLKKEIKALDKKLEQSWSGFYNRKIDSYLMLVDNLRTIDRTKLEGIDELSRELRRKEVTSEESLAPALSNYPLQKDFAVNYELLLAENLGLKLALDSLKKDKATSAKVFPRYVDVPFVYRSLVLYAPITLGNTLSYTDINAVPELKLPKKGLYYSVSVALTKGVASALAIFKGAQPLQVETTANGLKRYVIGGFRTSQQVEAAVTAMYKAGFRAPSAVAWLDGHFVTMYSAKAYEAKQPKEPEGVEYQIEVLTKNSQVAQTLRSVVDMHAKGKDISRVVKNDGTQQYLIFAFHSKAEAEVVSQIIRTKGDATVKVLTIE